MYITAVTMRIAAPAKSFCCGN